MKLICNFNTFISAHPQHLLYSAVSPTFIKGEKKGVHAKKQIEMTVNSSNVRSYAAAEVTSVTPHLKGELIRALPRPVNQQNACGGTCCCNHCTGMDKIGHTESDIFMRARQHSITHLHFPHSGIVPCLLHLSPSNVQVMKEPFYFLLLVFLQLHS